MLRIPTFEEQPQFKRFADGSCTWFGAPCRVLSAISEGTSYDSICFMHEDHAQNALDCLNAGGFLNQLYEAKEMAGMDEFRSHFFCAGLYCGSKLVGFWDMPLNWLEGAKLLSSKDVRSPQFQALLNAARTYAEAHPAGDPAEQLQNAAENNPPHSVDESVLIIPGLTAEQAAFVLPSAKKRQSGK